MNNKKRIIVKIIVVSSILVLTGCGFNTKKTASGEEESSVSSEITTEAIAAEAAETVAVVEDYVHGEDGYFNLLEEYPEIEMKYQEGGTCWLYAGACSMESNYVIKNNSNITINPLELLDRIYLDEKDEGFFPHKGINGKDLGGWQWMITETCSNGFGDYILDSSVVLDESDREAIKENLRTRGGVAVGVNDVYRNFKGLHGQYYTINYAVEQFDHDITIVGYDDHFPKEYYNIPASEDGAWIAYNSLFGPARFYYVSYCAPLEYAVSHSVTDRYSCVLAYDAGTDEERFVKTGEPVTMANVFHKAGVLAAVGTYNDFDGSQDIIIEIYDRNFTNLLYSQETVLDYRGYHTITLDEPINVTDYAIAITYSEGAPVEGETEDYGELDYVTTSDAGQSFVKLDKWRDLTEEGIEKELGTDYKPGNCCIKALYR